MAIDNGVKRRREERIRTILERNRVFETEGTDKIAAAQAPAAAAIPGTASDAGPHAAGSPGTGRPQPAAGRTGAEPDPETEWKRKSQEWLSSGTPPRSAWFGADEPSAPVRPKGGFGRSLFVKFVVSALLFGLIWGLFELDVPGAAPVRHFVVSALTEEMDTEAIAAWYGETFAGAPSFIPIFRQDDNGGAARVDGPAAFPVVAPVPSGEVVRTFAETLSGIDIAGRPSSAVVAVETGRVTHVTGGEDEGYSVVIQHANKRTSIYGRLRKVDVTPDEWVEAGDRIGELPASADGSRRLLYFAVRVDGKYVDPTDVVPLD